MEKMPVAKIYRANSQPRRGLRRNEAASYIGVSASKFDMLVADDRMPKPIKIDACSIWDLTELDAAFDELKTPISENPWDSAIEQMQASPSTLGQRHPCIAQSLSG
jgi:predicted DNA-binding transcriptional regulator AlpA